jgi:ketosteroid isomerase-like protein
LRAARDQWLAATNGQDLEALMAFYMPQVNPFYGSRNASHGAVRSHKSRVFAQSRSIAISVDDPEITFDDDGRRATMRFRKRWVIQGKRASRGAAVQELKWIKTDEGWRITSERNVGGRTM